MEKKRGVTSFMQMPNAVGVQSCGHNTAMNISVTLRKMVTTTFLPVLFLVIQPSPLDPF